MEIGPVYDRKPASRNAAPPNKCTPANDDFRHLFCSAKNVRYFSKCLLTQCLPPPYMPLTNEGGAPLAQTSSPL
jgi:hypothetical protein